MAVFQLRNRKKGHEQPPDLQAHLGRPGTEPDARPQRRIISIFRRLTVHKQKSLLVKNEEGNLAVLTIPNSTPTNLQLKTCCL